MKLFNLALAATFSLTLFSACSDDDGPIIVPTETVIDFEGDYWNALIDSEEYGGALLYGDSYAWQDPATTLSHSFAGQYWAGGHALSNYTLADMASADYTHQLSVPTAGGHNGSHNFVVHNGYVDDSEFGTCESAPAIAFADGKARRIKGMWVCPTTYFLNSMINGDAFNPAALEGEKVWITAQGYDAEGKATMPQTFMLYDNGTYPTDWTFWNLADMGNVVKVEFNVSGTYVTDWGFGRPAYFAYDDVTVVE